VVYRITPPSGAVLLAGLGSAVDGVATPIMSALASFGLDRRSAVDVMVAVLDMIFLRVDTISTSVLSSSSAMFIIVWGICVE